METMNTRIVKGVTVNNSPGLYTIIHKKSDTINTSIPIQKGPITDHGMNGVLIEDLILICIDQLEHYQDSDFKCKENDITLNHLRDALNSTRSRQYERMIRDVAGKYKK